MEKEYTEYQDLHKHQGTENYDVITLFNENSIIKEKLVERKQQFLSIINRDQKLKKSNRMKIGFFGNLKGEGYTGETLKDGTMWSISEYNNWLLNGDNKRFKYIDPFSDREIENPYEFENKEKDFKKWLVKFKEYYNKANYVYIWMSYYYFKVEGKWYMMKDDLEKSPIDFREQYPSKIAPEEVRMVKIPEVFDNLLENKTLQLAEYVEMDKQKSSGLNPISFSSGYYMFELHLPQGDILKFRRYSAMGFNADMNIYQIPKELGGSDEVFFIEQLPRQTYPDKSFAGFYAIRPKNYKELPEYKAYLEKEKK
ncbi:hypothetical protein Q4517_08795 [Tenacibaculum sp. 1_MG-2023]|uniref:hypothetical protein n=1 Tax=Tenacibaculum sp. 1_MG-2023 TaxID=3062653 RepID=UPI0026E15AFB|nr:hypothetical protein [Tenacibaculum sp. 1_MG-2023]MDO6675648.1 hypothetical protein [Tenacibaculum sp. 1_MG-2023]